MAKASKSLPKAHKTLPAHPHLGYLKKLAKERLDAMRADHPQTKLAAAQLAIAREHGFASWRALKAHVDQIRSIAPATSQRLGFIAFSVSDLDRSRLFYQDKLGGRILLRESRSIDVEFAGVRIRAYLHEGEYRRQHSGLQFLVAGLPNVVNRLRSAGVEFRSEIIHEPWGGKAITVADPDGNLFNLVDAAYESNLQMLEKEK